MIAQLVLIWS